MTADYKKIADYTWLFSPGENRLFFLIGKTYKGIDKTFEIVNYQLQEFPKPEPILVDFKVFQSQLEKKMLVEFDSTKHKPKF